jgi:TP901 family phage tail tape measure protein
VAVVGELLVILGGSNAALTSTLAKSEAELRAFSGTATTHGAHAAGGLHTVGVAALGVAGLVGVMGVASIKAAADFQEQMGIINTIAHQTPEELDKTGQSIRRLSTESGTGLGDLTQGFYDLLSAGVPATKAMDVLRQANTLAIGGLATTAQTVDLITTAINSYSLNTKQSAVATDQFALAVQDGKVTAAQIASTFADVAPLAHSMGIGIDEVSATYAVLTARGVPAAESMTQMNRAMVELQKPNADLNALQKKTGENFAEMARDKGLVFTLNEMRQKAAELGIPFQDLFGRLEGYKFALATTGPEFKAYTDELVKMHGATGTAAAQAAERMQTFDRQTAILGNSLQSLMIGIGTAFLPGSHEHRLERLGGGAVVQRLVGREPRTRRPDSRCCWCHRRARRVGRLRRQDRQRHPSLAAPVDEPARAHHRGSRGVRDCLGEQLGRRPRRSQFRRRRDRADHRDPRRPRLNGRLRHRERTQRRLRRR